ncbi:hypothetical protein D1AOALGA4SA_4620 [Olavius algarvensis Delta 1 endosymbiont]|nr:hypothetical protein D1AOALGA4SA_4620 [Olavius algarvensis Delta 1 endosymbiont]
MSVFVCSPLNCKQKINTLCALCGSAVKKNIIEPAHKLKIDQNKLQNCRSNILNLVNVL